MEKHFFTIITATYNAEQTLPRLLHSLAEQTCQDFIWICQDGASNDATVEIIKQWQDKISISAESCKDNGIYDAWNHAIKRQNENLGQWVLFLGADDVLAAPGVLEKAKQLLQNLSPEIFFGVGEKIDFCENNIDHIPTDTNIEKAFETRMLGMPFPHTALFSRSVLFKNELFDTSFRISADYDWVLRLWKRPNQASNLHILTTKMALGGVSTLQENARIMYIEKIKICLRHFTAKKWKYCFLISFCFMEDKLSKPKTAFMNLCKKNKVLTWIWQGLSRLRKKLFTTNT